MRKWIYTTMLSDSAIVALQSLIIFIILGGSFIAGATQNHWWLLSFLLTILFHF